MTYLKVGIHQLGMGKKESGDKEKDSEFSSYLC